MSGLHASINIHLSAQYAVPGIYCVAGNWWVIGPKCCLHVKGANGHIHFEPNLSQFVRRFDVATTRGQGKIHHGVVGTLTAVLSQGLLG